VSERVLWFWLACLRGRVLFHQRNSSSRQLLPLGFLILNLWLSFAAGHARHHSNNTHNPYKPKTGLS